MKFFIMDAEEIENAFSGRKLIDRNSEFFNFEELACSMARLQEVYQLNIIPSLMIYILDHKDSIPIINYAEMVVFRLMPQPKGWANLIDHMNRDEISATLKWLKEVKNCSFVVYCADELLMATDFFEECYGSN
jgi:hypothetical protein